MRSEPARPTAATAAVAPAQPEASAGTGECGGRPAHRAARTERRGADRAGRSGGCASGASSARDQRCAKQWRGRRHPRKRPDEHPPKAPLEPEPITPPGSGTGAAADRQGQTRHRSDEPSVAILKDLDDRQMPLLDHLIELRNRLMYSCAAIFVGFLVCYFFSEQIRVPGPPLADIYQGQTGRRMIYTGGEAFFTYVKVAFWAGAF